MSKSTVWASNAMINPAMLRPITHGFNDGSEEGKKRYTKAYYSNDNGDILSNDYFPSEIFVREDANKNYEKLPDLFFAGSYWVVSGDVAEIMKRFDLGYANLYPTKVFRKDRKTPIGDAWFCLNFGNVKNAYSGGGVNSTPYIPEPPVRHSPPTILKDNGIILNKEALEGPDIWVDPQIRSLFFVSDRLANALKDAGLARAFGFKKCKIL